MNVHVAMKRLKEEEVVAKMLLQAGWYRVKQTLTSQHAMKVVCWDFFIAARNCSMQNILAVGQKL
ncbi:hypothetical protein [Lysinibacillus yapensis]|uniref:hypothetical protein n=1 Tax=Ureibacillus yapensis TaxID=2304605 RepID=UPI001314D95C|nr:hypothetical protein [Lysinibacillus yapensis]